VKVVEFLNRRLLRLAWLFVAILAFNIVWVVTQSDYPSSRSVSIAPISATDAAVQRHRVDWQVRPEIETARL